MSLGMELGLGPRDIALHGYPLSILQKGAEPPIFGPYLLWPNGWMDQDAILGREVGLSPSDIVLNGDPAPLPQRGRSPQFSVHVYGGQMAGWIKMPLGREVGFSPSDIVLDGDPPGTSPLQKGGGAPPNFRSISVVASTDAWMDQSVSQNQDAT